MNRFIRTASSLAVVSFLAACGAENLNNPTTAASSERIGVSEVNENTGNVTIDPSLRVAGNPNDVNKLSPSDASLRACTGDTPRATGKPESFQKTLLSASGKTTVHSSGLRQQRTTRRE